MGKCDFVQEQAETASVPDDLVTARVEGIPAGQESGASGGAGWGDVVVGEGGGFGVEFVEVGSFDDGISVAGEVAVALIVGDDEDDVWSLRSKS